MSTPGATAPLTRVLLVRHGETLWNRDARYQGTSDIAMTDFGRAQILCLREHLTEMRIDGAYTSPLARARETARLLVAGHRIRPIIVDALREISYGAWQGRTESDIAIQDPARFLAWGTDPWSVRFPDGECLANVEARVWPAFRQILRRHCGGFVLICGHGHVNRVLIARCDSRCGEFWEVEQPNGACIEMMVSPTGEARWCQPLVSPRPAKVPAPC